MGARPQGARLEASHIRVARPRQAARAEPSRQTGLHTHLVALVPQLLPRLCQLRLQLVDGAVRGVQLVLQVPHLATEQAGGASSWCPTGRATRPGHQLPMQQLRCTPCIKCPARPLHRSPLPPKTAPAAPASQPAGPARCRAAQMRACPRFRGAAAACRSAAGRGRRRRRRCRASGCLRPSAQRGRPRHAAAPWGWTRRPRRPSCRRRRSCGRRRSRPAPLQLPRPLSRPPPPGGGACGAVRAAPPTRRPPSSLRHPCCPCTHRRRRCASPHRCRCRRCGRHCRCDAPGSPLRRRGASTEAWLACQARAPPERAPPHSAGAHTHTHPHTALCQHPPAPAPARLSRRPPLRASAASSARSSSAASWSGSGRNWLWLVRSSLRASCSWGDSRSLDRSWMVPYGGDVGCRGGRVLVRGGSWGVPVCGWRAAGACRRLTRPGLGAAVGAGACVRGGTQGGLHALRFMHACGQRAGAALAARPALSRSRPTAAAQAALTPRACASAAVRCTADAGGTDGSSPPKAGAPTKLMRNARRAASLLAVGQQGTERARVGILGLRLQFWWRVPGFPEVGRGMVWQIGFWRQFRGARRGVGATAV